MIYDWEKPKRYIYPEIFLNSQDRSDKYAVTTSNKRDVYVLMSIPCINNFYLKPDHEPVKTWTGFGGFSIGLDYYHHNNRFFNFTLASASDFFMLHPGTNNAIRTYERMNSSCISFSNNHLINRISFGYGLTYNINTWEIMDKSQSHSRDPIERVNRTAGLIFSSYYRAGRMINIGLVYRPTFFRISKYQPFGYEHVISLDVVWKMYAK